MITISVCKTRLDGRAPDGKYEKPAVMPQKEEILVERRKYRGKRVTAPTVKHGTMKAEQSLPYDGLIPCG